MGQQGYDRHERCNFTTATILVLPPGFASQIFFPVDRVEISHMKRPQNFVPVTEPCPVTKLI